MNQTITRDELDVERLARAIHNAECDCSFWEGERRPHYRRRAAEIAREYADPTPDEEDDE